METMSAGSSTQTTHEVEACFPDRFCSQTNPPACRNHPPCQSCACPNPDMSALDCQCKDSTAAQASLHVPGVSFHRGLPKQGGRLQISATRVAVISLTGQVELPPHQEHEEASHPLLPEEPLLLPAEPLLLLPAEPLLRPADPLLLLPLLPAEPLKAPPLVLSWSGARMPAGSWQRRGVGVREGPSSLRG